MIKTGDKVYRVCEYSAHDNEPSDIAPWRVEVRTVQQIGKRITIKPPFPGLWRYQWSLDALGVAFHETEAAALLAFGEFQRKEITALERHRERAIDALNWASGQHRKVNGQ